MFRELAEEEAMMWDEAANGIPFGVLCIMATSPTIPTARQAARLSARLDHGRAFDGCFRRLMKGAWRMGIDTDRHFISTCIGTIARW